MSVKVFHFQAGKTDRELQLIFACSCSLRLWLSQSLRHLLIIIAVSSCWGICCQRSARGWRICYLLTEWRTLGRRPREPESAGPAMGHFQISEEWGNKECMGDGQFTGISLAT